MLSKRWLTRLLLIGSLVSLPAAGAADTQTMALVGEARLKVLLWSVYHSRLYSEDGDYRPGQRPLRMEIEYLLPVTGDALVERTAQEWQGQGLQHERQDEWLQDLSQLWPDLEKRDVLALEVDADGVSTFYHNGRKLGEIADPTFAAHFLGIWLSPATSRPELRRALIGEG